MSTLDRFTRNLDWNLLKYFVQIARSGSIGAAAARLNMSQPSVSTALRRLEASVGAQLFTRTRTGVQPTAAGLLLLADAEGIAAMIARKPAEIGGATGALAGAVTVTTVSHVFSPALDEAIIAFRAQHPAVELCFAAGPWRQVLAALASGEAMIGIGFDDAPRPGLAYDHLTTERVQLYCGPTHRCFGTTLADLGVVADEAFVAFGEGEPPSIARLRADAGIGKRIGGLADSLQEASWMIALGLGIGFLPEPAVAAARHQLWPLLAPEAAPRLDVLLMRRHDLQDRAARALVEAIRDQIGWHASH